MERTLAFYANLFSRDFTAYTTRRLGQIGLSFASLFPLIYVGKHPGCTQSQLTGALGLDWGYSQRTVTRLTEEGFLTRTRQGRAWCLDLTPKGQEAFGLSHQVFWDWDAGALAGLTEAERNQLFTLLAKIQLERQAHRHVRNSVQPL